MSEDLENELQAIRSIYGNETLQQTGEIGVYILAIPQHDASLRLFFPPDYPESSPVILGTEQTGDHKRKGYGKQLVSKARDILQSCFIPGSVCMFDLLQELGLALADASEHQEDSTSGLKGTNDPEPGETPVFCLHSALEEQPNWTLSTPITEKKSTFLARACSVNSPAQAKAFIAHLNDTDKRVAKATHNITANRIRSPALAGSASEIIYQDCDDDGETAAGGRLLHLLQVMDVWGVLVVVSRWYGGVKLGPDRFSLINKVARDAIAGGGWGAGKGSKP